VNFIGRDDNPAPKTKHVAGAVGLGAQRGNAGIELFQLLFRLAPGRQGLLGLRGIIPLLVVHRCSFFGKNVTARQWPFLTGVWAVVYTDIRKLGRKVSDYGGFWIKLVSSSVLGLVAYPGII